ncbi:hypothetical protein [Chitinophaga arvensicola]|uniref:Uncharacterized protein n=1 Tax=Chitinophaga arvensicola TaxID=29529 RepID=A0A1I0S8T7_9BACT|nr:hypothetical protein [Chitinophaga arvensicola]SEW51263.1 hypothetical protein SAMN04488122_4186 [Chitinophaga arvensicola]
MNQITRPLYADEIRLLTKLKNKIIHKKRTGIGATHIILVLFTGLIFADLAYVLHTGFMAFVSGTFAVVCFLFVIFGPYEAYKDRRRARKRLRQLNQLLLTNTLEVTLVHAQQIAVGREFEDEGDLYLIAYGDGDVLYLWDNGHGMKGFPCLTFEIYKEDYTALVSRQIHVLSPKITPVEIEAEKKWKYLKKYGGPGHLATERVDFDVLLSRFYE